MDSTDATDVRRFGVAIAAMASTFRQEASEALLGGYRLGLGDLAIESIEQAVAGAIRGCKFMPSAAELRELAGVMLPEHRAVKAWRVLMDATRDHCPYHSVVFDDPLITVTLRNLAGGDRAWEVWAEMVEAEEEKWLRKDFERVYVAMARSGITADAARPLIGFHDRGNSEQGYGTKQPRLIACGLPPLPGGPVAVEGQRGWQKLLEDVGSAKGGTP